MKKCQYCGTEFDDTMNLCPVCGNIEENNPSTTEDEDQQRLDFKEKYENYLKKVAEENAINDSLNDDELSAKALSGDIFACHSLVVRKWNAWVEKNDGNFAAITTSLKPYYEKTLEEQFFYEEKFIALVKESADVQTISNTDLYDDECAIEYAESAWSRLAKYGYFPSEEELEPSDADYLYRSLPSYSVPVLIAAQYFVKKNDYSRAEELFDYPIFGDYYENFSTLTKTYAEFNKTRKNLSPQTADTFYSLVNQMYLDIKQFAENNPGQIRIFAFPSVYIVVGVLGALKSLLSVMEIRERLKYSLIDLKNIKNLILYDLKYAELFENAVEQ